MPNLIDRTKLSEDFIEKHKEFIDYVDSFIVSMMLEKNVITVTELGATWSLSSHKNFVRIFIYSGETPFYQNLVAVFKIFTNTNDKSVAIIHVLNSSNYNAKSISGKLRSAKTTWLRSVELVKTEYEVFLHEGSAQITKVLPIFAPYLP